MAAGAGGTLAVWAGSTKTESDRRTSNSRETLIIICQLPRRVVLDRGDVSQGNPVIDAKCAVAKDNNNTKICSRLAGGR